jgi:hypothetical protein
MLVMLMAVGALGVAANAASGDSLSYRIRVVDATTRPVAGATVWVLGQAHYRTEFQPADMARMVRRYRADADFILTGSLLGSEWVLRTAPDGTVTYLRTDKDVHGLQRVRTSFAGLKRGFLPVQVDDEAPIHSRREIVIRLKRDPGVKVDPRMDEFDRLRALANPGNDIDDPFATHRSLDPKVDARLRELAAGLEQDGQRDDAAAIYYNLSYLPGVGAAAGPEGENPTGTADYERFRKLTRGHPQFEYEAMKATYLGQGLDFMTAKGAPLRRDYIAATEKLIRQHGERLWPYTHGSLEWAYVSNGEFEAGCRALRAFHDFEPSVNSVKGWTKFVESFQQRVRENGGPAKMPCEIAGVPPP